MAFNTLLSLAAGLLACWLLTFLLVKDPAVRRFWILRTAAALGMGILLWKLTPLWTRWGDVLDNPLGLLWMNAGMAAVLGGLFAGVTVAALSLLQVRKEKPGHPRWPLAVPVAAGLALTALWTFAEPAVVPRPGSEPGPAVQMLVPGLEGPSHALADWRGRVVVVNFWASGSPPCRAEVPDLRDYYRSLPPGVVLVGVNLDGVGPDGAPRGLAFAEKHQLGWTHLTDPGAVLTKAFAVSSLPTTVVLDPAGRVVDRREGPADLYWLRTLEGRFGR